MELLIFFFTVRKQKFIVYFLKINLYFIYAERQLQEMKGWEKAALENGVGRDSFQNIDLF